MKKRIALLLVFVLMLSLFAGCSGKPGNGPSQQTDATDGTSSEKDTTKETSSQVDTTSVPPTEQGKRILPEIAGLTEGEARKRLIEAGFPEDTPCGEVDDRTILSGTVIGYADGLTAGMSVPEDDVVTFLVAIGNPGPYKVVSDEELRNKAKELIQTSGFVSPLQVSRIYYRISTDGKLQMDAPDSVFTCFSAARVEFLDYWVPGLLTAGLNRDSYNNTSLDLWLYVPWLNGGYYSQRIYSHGILASSGRLNEVITVKMLADYSPGALVIYEQEQADGALWMSTSNRLLLCEVTPDGWYNGLDPLHTLTWTTNRFGVGDVVFDNVTCPQNDEAVAEDVLAMFMPQIEDAFSWFGINVKLSREKCSVEIPGEELVRFETHFAEDSVPSDEWEGWVTLTATGDRTFAPN